MIKRAYKHNHHMASVTTPRKSKNKEGKKTSTPDSSGSARMDLGERRRHDFDGGSWTDEKHISFLNWMEASFVKRMHERDDQQQLLTYAAAAVDSHLPLDRYLPDGSDSTVDFHNQRPNMNEKKSQANNRHDGARRATNGRRERKRRNGSQDDQVVPQLECRK